ncbi:AmiS/UreI family transporter [Arthrobacter globiformis]|uniref:AmiS/UreI family transporter n=1 Tax=Arthrobacter globiformis TaxID=1665 RepID=UPI00277E4C63|nr:AmiS/UreI family transporter [Arthrobacter globiformis]MDQ0863063.1 hypothetical protein [Arthrobacter globiformis]
MAYVCLLLSGAALLINGLATLGALPRRDAAVLSLVIGSLQLLLGSTHLAVTYLGNVRLDSTAPDADGGVQLLLSASGMFLFGLTYVYVGLDFLLGLGSRGLGWFCGMVGGCGLLLAAAWFPEDPLLAVLWLCWSYLWMLFFFSLALDHSRLSPLIGWSLVLASQATATVPGPSRDHRELAGRPRNGWRNRGVHCGAAFARRRPCQAGRPAEPPARRRRP